MPEEEIDATDAAIELAEASGIDLAEVEGTGEGGRILKADVEAAIETAAEAEAQEDDQALAPPAPEEEAVEEAAAPEPVAETQERVAQSRMDNTCGFSQKTNIIKP